MAVAMSLHMPKLDFTEITTGAFWLWSAGRHLHSRWRLYQAKSWPLVSGAIEHAASKVVPKAGGATPTVRLSYSYQLNGEWYAGSGSLEFGDEDQAAEFTHKAKGNPIHVSVNPRNPADSAITAEQSRSWSKPTTAGEWREGYAFPPATRFIVHLLTLAGVIGLAVSLYIQVAAWVGSALPPIEIIFGSLFGSLLLTFVSTMVAVRLETLSARGRHAAPSWMRYALYVLWANAGVNLFLALFVETGHDLVFSARFLSSFTLLAFMTTFAKLYAAARARKPRAVDAGIWREV